MRTSPFSDGLAPHFDPDGILELAGKIYGRDFDDMNDFRSYIIDEPDEVRMRFCRYMYRMSFKHLGKAMAKIFWYAPMGPHTAGWHNQEDMEAAEIEVGKGVAEDLEAHPLMKALKHYATNEQPAAHVVQYWRIESPVDVRDIIRRVIDYMQKARPQYRGLWHEVPIHSVKRTMGHGYDWSRD